MKQGCRIKHSGFSTAIIQCSKVPQSFWAGCSRFVMFPMQKHVHVFFIYSVLGFAVPAQDSPQGTAAAPKCIFTSAQMVPMCSGTHRNAPVGEPVGLCQENLQIVLKQHFLLRKKRGVMVGTSVMCCQLLVVISRLGLQWQGPLGWSSWRLFIKQQQNSFWCEGWQIVSLWCIPTEISG